MARFEDKYHLALELFEVRLMLEPEIAALASEYASEEEKAQLESLCDQVERQYTAGINHIKKDIEFHTCIAKCSRNRVVEILIPLINSSVSTFATLTRRQLMKETIETHRAVTNAILKGDSVGARCAMIMHLTYNRAEAPGASGGPGKGLGRPERRRIGPEGRRLMNNGRCSAGRIVQNE